MESKPLNPAEQKILDDLYTRFKPNLEGYVNMVQTLFNEGNIEAISLALRLISVSLEVFAGQAYYEKGLWWSDHLKGNC